VLRRLQELGRSLGARLEALGVAQEVARRELAVAAADIGALEVGRDGAYRTHRRAGCGLYSCTRVWLRAAPLCVLIAASCSGRRREEPGCVFVVAGAWAALPAVVLEPSLEGAHCLLGCRPGHARQ
jgi:hypothetical protein